MDPRCHHLSCSQGNALGSPLNGLLLVGSEFLAVPEHGLEKLALCSIYCVHFASILF